ncbi:MATE family efflux transporter [[Pseudopropionibacterium] massiliense]|uniref:MATE family efflux transporter n=1 Tax=[Pseudopropionibacterium] massiliense TaxID=2220000 RepID=UPI001A92DCC3|nr:MATE family efflux transporter [[Pseudopropionibacterium] massiliense]
MSHSLNRRILELALPAFAALVAQPLFVMADTAIVGQLGTDPLAGLGVGSTLTLALAGMFVFLAYGSTATVARLMGAGREKDAAESGIQAMWLALLLGAVVGAISWGFAPQLAAWLGAEGVVHEEAVAYLRWSLPGLPGMFLVLAATGTLRGMADGRTPMVLAIGAAVLNLAGDIVLVLGLGTGIAGSGAATAFAETLMGLTAAGIVARGAARVGARRGPRPAGMRTGLVVGVPLLIRTLALRAALLLTTWAAARSGAVALAAHQVGFTVWSFLQYVLDALAIAGQTLIGQALGASRPGEARALSRRMTGWSLCAGLLLGIVTLLVRHPLASLFTPDREVRDAVAAVLVVIGGTLVIASWVTLFDGVLIGAGDGPYLARASLITLAVYAPLALAVTWLARGGLPGLVWLWLAFTIGFMGTRAVTLWWRERSDAWLVTG